MVQSVTLEMDKLELILETTNGHVESESDPDESDIEEIDAIFHDSECLNETIVQKNEYILHVDATRESDPNIATASRESCMVYKLEGTQVAQIADYIDHTNIIDCRFSSGNSNLLYTGSSDGSIRLWDLRTPKNSSLNFVDNTVENDKDKKSFSCFDVSSNDRLLTVGTNVFEGDAFLLFWDTRNQKLMGGYWDSHTDDITQVKFHPEDMNKLMSGSTDGLINIYDLTQTKEDDALTDTLNSESSIDQLMWFSKNRNYGISCMTHTFDLQLWNVDDAEPYRKVDRTELAKGIKKKSESYIYTAKCHQAKNDLMVLVGSNFGGGECMRGLQIKEKEVSPSIGFKKNKQIVRCSWFNENKNILLTGGENGILNVWKVGI
ncbi:unnamed protein product [Phaedon cochleariae]|uniref:WD repeat-containing protein 89 n=1 Tax=Phaedon cochleariae TaxID=80249 RepID=A0A9P0GVU7_PHACE|nr:unnamed protein product [Phaedon cochleariae]